MQVAIEVILTFGMRGESVGFSSLSVLPKEGGKSPQNEMKK